MTTNRELSISVRLGDFMKWVIICFRKSFSYSYLQRIGQPICLFTVMCQNTLDLLLQFPYIFILRQQMRECQNPSPPASKIFIYLLRNWTDFFIIKPTRCTNLTNLFFHEILYMFRTFRLPIIRSLFTVHSAMVYAVHICRHLSSRTRMELEFHPGPARKLSTNLYDIYQYRVYSE